MAGADEWRWECKNKGIGGVGVCAEVHGEFTYQFAGTREAETCSRDINFSYSRGQNVEPPSSCSSSINEAHVFCS